MAYLVKYYKELISQGQEWRLEIQQDTDEDLTAVEIGPVLQGLRLIMQGDQADIDTPIVKTSLEMVFVDAPDLESERKCGYWEEFYTSSATEYKVVLIKNRVMEWTGYITPDSFSESLQYRGSVTIIARDNLGALQDFEYDYISDSSGMVSLLEIYIAALEKIAFPMERALGYQFAWSADLTSTKTHSILFNNESFKDKTWQEALESVLMPTGLVLRYVGGNTFKLLSIREIPLCGKQYWWDVPILDVAFCAYGQRELSPAVKTIIDEVNFEIEENIASVVMPASAYGEAGEYEILTASENIQELPMIYPMPVHAVVGGAWSARSAAQSLFLNPFAFPLKEGHSSKKIGNLRDESAVYILTNDNAGTGSPRSADIEFLVGPGNYKLSFGVGHPIALYDDNTKVGHIDIDVKFSRFVFTVRFISSDGEEKYEYRTSSNSWISGTVPDLNSTYPNVALPTSFELPELEVTKIGKFQLIIKYVGVVKTLDSPSGISKGAYLPFKDFSLIDASLENSIIPGYQKITTSYNVKNNILLQRRLDYGFNDGDVASPHIIKNGMFIYKDSRYVSADEWIFNNGEAGSPLPVLIHQQLLAYYSKPNNMLTGELATDSPIFNALYKWNGRDHLLTSGAFNVITGRMENVVLREFLRYDQMWETWIEKDDYKVMGLARSLSINVHAKEVPIVSIPSNSWISVKNIQRTITHYILNLTLDINTSSNPREIIISIDTALARITQNGLLGPK